MTFDELMKKFEAQVDEAIGEILHTDANDGSGPAYKTLEKALAVDLIKAMPNLESDKLAKSVTMLAKELVSMKLYPESSGAAYEGGLEGSSTSSMNPDIMDGADEPAPEPVVLKFR
jgi:hypothetical protein